MAKGIFEFITAACGVTPQAQNTGISPASIREASPKSGPTERARRFHSGKRKFHDVLSDDLDSWTQRHRSREQCSGGPTGRGL